MRILSSQPWELGKEADLADRLKKELDRIVGGEQAAQGQFPFIASLKIKYGKGNKARK